MLISPYLFRYVSQPFLGVAVTFSAKLVFLFLGVLLGCDESAQKASKRGDLGNVDISAIKQNHILVPPNVDKKIGLDYVDISIPSGTFSEKTAVIKIENLDSLKGVKLASTESGSGSYVIALRDIEVCLKVPSGTDYTHVKIKSAIDGAESSVLGVLRESKLCIQTKISSGVFEVSHGSATESIEDNSAVTEEEQQVEKLLSGMSILIQGGDYTIEGLVDLTINAVNADQMYITNTLGCAGGGDWESYASLKGSWSLEQLNALATVYVKFKDLAGNESNCISDSITHDDEAPSSLSLVIGGGEISTSNSSPNLAISAVGASEMYVTNTAECVSGGSWEVYASEKSSWALGQSNALATVYVKFKDLSGNESSCVSDSITHDDEAPSSLSLAIDGGDFTSTISRDLAISAVGASEMYVTNVADCVDGGNWESYAPMKSSWTLEQSKTLATVYVKFKDLTGNVSSCVSDGIIHDSIAPSDPGAFSSGAESLSLSLSSILSWAASSDSGSGVSFYEVSIGTSAADTSVSDWSNVGDVLITTISGLSLTEGATYYANIRSTDNAGNTGGVVSISFLGEKKVVDLESGHWHVCARFEDSNIKCWGDNTLGSLGQDHAYSIGDAASEMGSNLSNVNVGSGRTVLKMAAGGYHSCAVLDNNSVKCWGYNASGQAGQGTTGSIGNEAGEMASLSAVDLGTSRTAQNVVTGRYHSCAHLDDNTVKCWGENSAGQLGLGDSDHRGDTGSEMGDDFANVDLGTGRTANLLVAGYRYNCVLMDNSAVKCWGENDEGQLGQGSSSHQGDDGSEMGDDLGVVDLGTNRTAIGLSAGEDHACAVLDTGHVKCWGENGYGQLGYGDSNNRGDVAGEMGDNLLNVDLGTGRTALQVDAGYNFTCALLDDNTVKCWGKNLEGQLGQGNTASLGDDADEMGDDLGAVDLGLGRTALKISIGEAHVCAILDTYQIKCWGYNSDGQLGQGHDSSVGDAGSEMGDDLPIIDL
ncbi:MAG: RCC1 domain-containing protein [Oligoflexales bacterium]